ncbi:hypothetical protein EDD11_003791 [Mortierella claussenii]|nr:hypothetical protein EDD11_003791 [Mortierella claussenii]
MMRRRQDKHQQDQLSRSDLDGDGYYTNNQGYRDGTDEGAHGTFTGSDKQEGTDSGDSNPHSRHPKGLTASLKSGVATRRPLLQRLRKAFMPTLVGVLLGWWYDATDVLIYRKDSRIKG